MNELIIDKFNSLGLINILTPNELRAAFEEYSKIAERVRNLRDYGYSMTEIADALDISDHQVQSILAGDSKED